MGIAQCISSPAVVNTAAFSKCRLRLEKHEAETGNKQTNSSPPEEEESKSTQQTTTTEELNKENEENMEEIEPAPQYCFYPDEFMQNLNDKHNKRKIEKRNAIDKL